MADAITAAVLKEHTGVLPQSGTLDLEFDDICFNEYVRYIIISPHSNLNRTDNVCTGSVQDFTKPNPLGVIRGRGRRIRDRLPTSTVLHGRSVECFVGRKV